MRWLPVFVLVAVLSGCGSHLICGGGTIELNGECIARCGAGTELDADAGACVARCGAGTELDAGMCVPVTPVTPVAGGACTTTGFVCASASLALECRNGLWRGLPCRGPTGCTTSGSVKCDMHGALVGDECASTTAGSGLCRADGKAVLECRASGTVFAIVQTLTCTSCTETATQITCVP